MRTLASTTALAGAAWFFAACGDGSTTSPPLTPQFVISDAVHNSGDARFFWLPPLVADPGATGEFDGDASPIVTIDDMTTSAEIARFTMDTGPGSETLRVSLADEHYIVNWHTDDFGLDPETTYRINVSVDGFEMGYADVDVVGSGKELRHVNTGEYIALLDGRTLPIKFRLEQGEPEPPTILPFECENGSFESGTPGSYPWVLVAGSTQLSGWEVTVTSIQWFNPLFNAGTGSAPDGNLIVDLNGDFPLNAFFGGGIRQTVPTVPGQTYRLTFLAGTSKFGGRPGTGTVQVLIDNVLLETFQLTSAGLLIEWESYEVLHEATASSTTIELRSLDPTSSSFAFIDQVCG